MDFVKIRSENKNLVYFKVFIYLGCYLLAANSVNADPQHYRVVSLFEKEHKGLELAFQNAMTKMNMHAVAGTQRKLLYHTETPKTGDSFEVNRKVCRQMKEGIAAVFGPVSEIPRLYVQSLCTAFEIPHLQAQWDPRETWDYFSINLYPEAASLSRSQAELIHYWKWTEFTVLFEDNESLLRLQEVFKFPRGDEYSMVVRKLERTQGGYVNLLKDLKDNMEYRMVIDCDVTKIAVFLEEADSMGMLSEYYHFHFTSLDLSLVHLDQYLYKGVNITGMRLVDPSRDRVVDIMAEWEIMEKNLGESPLMGNNAIPTENALMYDAVHLLAKSIGELNKAQNINTEPLSCNNKKTIWTNGGALLNYMKAIPFEGLSGDVEFENGQRRVFELGIVKLKREGLVKIGSWTPKGGAQIAESETESTKEDYREMLKNKTLRIVTVLDKPYVQLKTDLEGNPEVDENGQQLYEGFIIDLLELLQRRLRFRYDIYIVPDEQYGSKQADGTWNGMIGDLMLRDSKDRADLAAGGITITYGRAKVVDFTKPFLNLGITILYKKPTKPPPELFSFLSPLSVDVWIYMIAAYLCVSFMLFIIARFTPYEWENPHPCDTDSEEVENQFTILNSLWFTIGSLMQQGSDIAPKCSSTRFVASVWYLFTLITVSSYTANLAAFLTVKRMSAPVTSAEDLSKQTDIHYGTSKAGATNNFFKTSNRTEFKRMWSFMSANADQVLVKDNDEGFHKVKNSNYAYLGESTTLDYQIQRNCDLMQIGDLLDSKGYGLAMPKDSPWMEYISNEIVYLQEKQNITKLYTKWWKEKSPVKCATDEEKIDTNALGFENVGGVFILLMGGSLFGLLIAILEFLWKVFKNSRKDNQSFLSEMTEELRFIIKCKSQRSDVSSTDKEISDNGVQFTAIPNNNKHNER